MVEDFFERKGWSVWLVVVAGLLMFAPLDEGGTTHTAVMFIRLLILLLAAVYAWHGISRGGFRYHPVVIRLPLVAFLGLALISTLTSPYIDQSRQWLVVLFSYSGLLLLLIMFVQRWEEARRLLLVFVSMAVGEAVISLGQGWSGEAVRPTGTFFNPNFLAVYLAAAWTCLFAGLCFADWSLRRGGNAPLSIFKGGNRPTQDPFLPRRVSIPILVVLLAAIVWTGSRGGLLALVVGTGVVVAVRFGRRALLVLTAMLVVLLLAPNPFRDRLAAEHRANPETYARFNIWGHSLLEMADHPLGIGLGLYQYRAMQYMFPIEGQIVRYGKIANTAHNEYLQMGVELGVVSIVIFLWGVYLIFAEVRRILRSRLLRWHRGMVVGLVGAISVILVHAAVDSPFHSPALAILLVLCVGLLLSLARLVRSSAQPTEGILVLSARPVWTAVAVGGLLVLAIEVIRLGLAWQAYEHGSTAAMRQEIEQALSNYRTATMLDPGKALYHSALASGYFQSFQRTRDIGSARSAVRELQVASDLNPLDGRLSALAGGVCQALVASGAAELNTPGSRAVLINMARKAFERAVELEPFVPGYRLELGRLSLDMGERSGAEAWVRGAVELEPNYLPGREWLARFYLLSGRREAAMREFVEIRDRQQRYEQWPKNQLERQYLGVDVKALEAMLQVERSPA